MDEARWDFFFKLGMDAYERSDWDQARQAFEVAVEEARQADEPDSRLARSLNNLACALSHLGRVPESVALQEQALAVSQQVFGSDHEVVAGSLLNLAADYARLQRFPEAESLFLRALQALEGHALEPQGLENFSQFYLAQQKLPEAAQVLEKLAIRVAGQPEEQARVWHTLAHVYDALQRPAEADELRRRTLESCEQLWGAQTLAFGEVAGNMAESLMAHERYAEAAPLYARAEQALGACVPGDDARLLGSLLGQLICLREAGQLQEAEALGQRMVQSWQGREGGPPGDFRRWLNELAMAIFLQGRAAEAAALFERSLDLPGDYPVATRVAILFNLGSARLAEGKLAEAQIVLENVAGLAEEHLTAQHQLTWRVWLQLSELYRQTGQTDALRATREKLDRHTLSGQGGM